MIPATKAFAAAAAIALALAGCGAGSGPDTIVNEATNAPSPLVEGRIIASDQTSDGTRVTVDSATITSTPGFVVLHADADGAPGEVLGSEPIREGRVTDVEIEASETLTSGPYWVMLHRDADTHGLFQFPGPDVPVSSEGQIVMQRIEVTVE